MISYRLVMFTFVATQALMAQRVGVPTDDLDKISMEELFSVEVTSVGKKAQQLSKAPAAVFVLTAEDIRRSGATSIPEALQWVPGLTVLKIDGRNWAISARGSTRLYANKMLVMIDGRSMYTPLFAGVIWDAIDVPLENIEQIEVVRGPGAVMWGPNAVNGVINIITKRAASNKGALLSTASGNELRGSGFVRYGASLSDRTDFRVWGKAEERVPGFSSPGYFSPADRYLLKDPLVNTLNEGSVRLGFRVDSHISPKDELSIQGDLYATRRQDPLADVVMINPNTFVQSQGNSDYQGGFIQARWTHTRSAGDESTVQFSYDKTDLNYPYFGWNANNLTADYQRRRQTNDRNEVFYGAGVQTYSDGTYSNRAISFTPAAGSYQAENIVARDEFQFVPGRWIGSAGIRVDYNNYSHLEYQPSFRLLYTPTGKQSAWVAWSRAVRVPSRYDRDINSSAGTEIIQGFPIHEAMIGSVNTVPEIERSTEAGYRFQAGQHWSVDVSAYWSVYEKLRVLRFPVTPELDLSGPTPQLILNGVETSGASGRTYGGEFWVTFQAARNWRLSPSYSYLDESRSLPTSSTGTFAWDGPVASLRHQAVLRSQHDLTRRLQLDILLRARSRNPEVQLPGGFIADAHLSWKPIHGGELSLGVQDLTNRQQLATLSEGPFVALPSRRTYVIKWTQQF